MGVNSEEVGAGGIDAGDDQVGTDVTLVLEEVLLQEGHAGDHAGLPAGGQGVQLELGGDEGGGELGIGGGSGAGAPDLWGDVVQLLAVLVGDDRAARGPRIGGDLCISHGCECAGFVGENHSPALLSRHVYCPTEQETYHDTTIVYAAHDGGTCAGRFG